MRGGRALRVGLGVLAAVILAAAALPLVLDPETEVLDAEARRQASGQFVQLASGITHYELAGPRDGFPVVMIHGGSVPYYVWDETFGDLVQAGFRVLRYDQFGRGFSDRPDVVYDRELLEGQLAQLLDAVGIEGPVPLIGVSMGGGLAVSFTDSHPQRVRALVLEDPLNRSIDVAGLDLPLVGPWLMAVNVAPAMPEDQMNDFYHPERFPHWVERYREQMRYRGFRRATLSIYRNYIGIDFRKLFARVGRLGLPTLLIWGQEDRVIPFSDSAAVRELLSPEFLAVPEAGHLAHKERPDLVDGAVVAFLDRLQASEVEPAIGDGGRR